MNSAIRALLWGVLGLVEGCSQSNQTANPQNPSGTSTAASISQGSSTPPVQSTPAPADSDVRTAATATTGAPPATQPTAPPTSLPEPSASGTATTPQGLEDGGAAQDDAGASMSGAPSGSGSTAMSGSPSTSDTGGVAPSGPSVDRTNPQLYTLSFTAAEADSAASTTLGRQFAYLDTRATPRRQLVVYLHGAGTFNDCGNGALGELVASFGYHWFGPCYLSNYGVENCGNDIAGCRMEAFEGVDHHAFVNISRPNSIEERLVRGLQYLQENNPEGDWDYYLDGELPRWSEIIITGHSHGASTSGLIGMTRGVDRVVMLAGPNDPNQPWLSQTPITPASRFFGFSHSGDGQHAAHLAAFEALDLPGQPTSVDNNAPPYGDSHRLVSSANVGDAHGSVNSGDVNGFIAAWTYLYGASE